MPWDTTPRGRLLRRLPGIQEHYPKIRKCGAAELRRLELPPNLLQYWEGCLYCEYTGEAGEADLGNIRRGLAHEERLPDGTETGKWIPGTKSLPELPYTTELSWHDEEDTHDPWIRVEVRIHRGFVTQNLLDAIARRVFRMLRRHISYAEGIDHPLVSLINRAKVNPQQRKRNAVARYQRGEALFEDLLEEEWATGHVQAELQSIVDTYGGRPHMLQKKLRYLQDKVYNRVRRWLPEPRPTVERKGTWRKKLGFPTDRTSRAIST